MTSTLQQEASRQARFSAQQNNACGQRLYENGYITYMRTRLHVPLESAVVPAREQARELYGADAVPGQPAAVQPASKNAQEGRRGDPSRRRSLPHAPDEVRGELGRDEYALYELVWKRRWPRRWPTRGRDRLVRLGATAADGRDAEFGTAGT